MTQMEHEENGISRRKAERIMKIYNWTRYILLAIIILLLYIFLGRA